MKDAKISFRVFGDSGPLTLSWSNEAKGPAEEAKKGSGVGFFSKDGTLLCVEFDDVDEETDHQQLDFDASQVEIWVKNGKVRHEVRAVRTSKTQDSPKSA